MNSPIGNNRAVYIPCEDSRAVGHELTGVVLDRRTLLGTLAALSLTGCGKKTPSTLSESLAALPPISRNAARVVVADSTLTAKNHSNGKIFEVSKVLLQSAHGLNQLSEYRDISFASLNSIELYRFQDDGQLIYLNLNSSILDRLVKFFSDRPFEDQDDFDCDSFICFIQDPSYLGDNIGYFRSRSYSEINTENPVGIGEVVLLANPDTNGTRPFNWDQPFHFALSIGEGLFLSKFGSNGPLIVATAEEMAKGFQTTKLLKVSSRE